MVLLIRRKYVNQLASIAKPWVQGLTTYQPGRPIEEVARELGLGDPKSILKLASNENTLGPSPRAVEAMLKHASNMHVYPDGDNYHLRQALSRHLNVDANQVFMGHGSNEILQLLGHVFLDASSNVVVSDHAFIVYRLVAALYQAKVTSVPMREYQHDLSAMAKAVTAETKMLFIANPNNPTGTIVGRQEIVSFMKDLPPHLVVVFDEAYIELVPDACRPETIDYVRQDRNVFVLRTFSKAYGLAGLRIGYALAPSNGVDLLHRVRQPFNVNAMAQAAALAALDDTSFVQQTRETVASGLRHVSEALNRMGVPYVPSAANFLLVKVGEGRRIFSELQKEGVIVRPVDVYDLPEYVRITIGTRTENDRMLDALSRVLARHNMAS